MRNCRLAVARRGVEDEVRALRAVLDNARDSIVTCSV